MKNTVKSSISCNCRGVPSGSTLDQVVPPDGPVGMRSGSMLGMTLSAVGCLAHPCSRKRSGLPALRARVSVPQNLSQDHHSNVLARGPAHFPTPPYEARDWCGLHANINDQIACLLVTLPI